MQVIASRHTIDVPGGDWRLWRLVCLRGAGFPASLVLSLAAPELATLTDKLFEVEAEVERSRSAALECLGRDMKTARTEERPPLRKALRRLKRCQPPQLPGRYNPETAQTLEHYAEAREKLQSLTQPLAGALEQAHRHMRQVLRDVACRNDFREAIIWQNRRLVDTTLEPLLRRAVGESDSQTRHREQLIANYLQRYCMKNDTIGFFGPVGWAHLMDSGGPAIQRPGPELVSHRTVYFESWTLEALAEKLEGQVSLFPWLAPRLQPWIQLEEDGVRLPAGQHLALSHAHLRLLRTCDGTRSAQGLAAEWAATEPAFPTEEHLFAFLRQGVQQGLLAWKLAPAHQLHPERALRATLQQVQDEAARGAAMDALETLETARDQVGRAAGNAAALDKAMAGFEETFTRLTGKPSSRKAGENYAARTPLYEDCRRDTEVKFGPALTSRLGPCLTLLVTSARWFTYEVARRCRARLESLYNTLSDGRGGPVPMARFYEALMQLPTYKEDLSTLPVDVTEAARELRHRWEELLSLPPGQRRVERSAAELRPHVLAAFDAPGAGWPAARHISPDILLAASGPEALERGDFQCVLGEVHLCNTMLASFFVSQHPRPEELRAAVEADEPGMNVIPITPSYIHVQRTERAILSQRDFLFHFSDDVPDSPPERLLPIGALVVERDSHGLRCRTLDGHHRFDVIDFLGYYLSAACSLGQFSLLGEREHSPRVSIDGVVVARESWRFQASSLPFLWQPAPLERLLGLRRWARGYGLPRFVFCKVPGELKPFYVDFDSPVYVELLAKMVRKAAAQDPAVSFRLTEMLPLPDETWLRDAQGNCYTCELRMAAVDPLPAATLRRDSATS